MHTCPIFTDEKGRQFKQPRKSALLRGKLLRTAILAFIAGSSPFMLVAAINQLDAGTQIKGILKIANGGTGTSSTLTGLVRGSGSAMTAAELSGDVTTSGSNVATVAKINGTTVPTTSTTDQVLVTTAAGVSTWKNLGDTAAGGLALTYNATTDTWGTIAVLSGSFAVAEVPSGTINGSNDTFTVANTPSPAGSLMFFKNGQLMTAEGVDYTLSAATVTFVTGAIPQTGDQLISFYRY